MLILTYWMSIFPLDRVNHPLYNWALAKIDSGGAVSPVPLLLKTLETCRMYCISCPVHFCFSALKVLFPFCRIGHRHTSWKYSWWRENSFSSCHERETKKKFWVLWGTEPQTFGFRASMLFVESILRCLTLVTRRKTSLSIYFPSSKLNISLISIYKHYAIDITDTSSMEDACQMNFVRELAHRGVSVAQW